MCRLVGEGGQCGTSSRLDADLILVALHAIAEERECTVLDQDLAIVVGSSSEIPDEFAANNMKSGALGMVLHAVQDGSDGP